MTVLFAVKMTFRTILKEKFWSEFRQNKRQTDENSINSESDSHIQKTVCQRMSEYWCYSWGHFILDQTDQNV